jgi:hypothetical protein
MGFQEGGQYLPGDYVDEGKLLLFIKDKVASYAPHKGQRLKAEQARRRRKRKGLELGPRPAKHQRGALGPRSEGGESSAEDKDRDRDRDRDGDKDKDDKPASDLLLMYNSV